jgi:hypothetical protein
MNTKNKIRTILTFALVAMVFGGLATTSANAAIMTASATAPDVGSLDIANYTDTGNLDKWFCLPNEWASRPVGQTFTPDVGVQFSAITYQLGPNAGHQAPPIKTYIIRVCTVDRVNPGDSDTWVLTEIYSETCTQEGFTANPSDFMTWTLDTPVLLAAGIEYGVDVGMTSTTTPWGDGIAYILYSTADEYAGGTRYWSGQRDTQTGQVPGLGNSLMNNVSGDRLFHIALLSGDPNAPSVDAGVDMITWSGQAVTLAPDVTNNDPGGADLTYLWSAENPDPNITIVFDPAVNPADPNTSNVEAPTVTIANATDNPSVVTLTLAVNNVGRLEPPVEETMTIDVYDDACEAAKGVGPVVFDSTDFNADCITNLADCAELAAAWLYDYTITAPVPQ